MPQEIWTQLGATGVFITFLIGMVYRYEKRMERVHMNHRDERDGWKEQAREQHIEVVEVAKNSNILLAQIKLLIERQVT